MLNGTQKLLDQYGIVPDPLRDQHFCIDSQMMEIIVKSANIKPTDIVLEIGPGTGNLTDYLIKTGAKITAIEIDKRFSKILKNKKANIIYGDVLMKMKRLKFNKIVSNIPYAISESLLMFLTKKDFDLAVLSVPSNFSQKVLGGTKLGLIAGSFFNLEVISTFGKDSFYPQPKTKTSVMKIEPLDEKYYKSNSGVYVMRQVFRHPGKKLENGLTEALIAEMKLNRKTLTKKMAKSMITGLYSRKLLNKRINELTYADFRFIQESVPLT